jgi:hypothetical protein
MEEGDADEHIRNAINSDFFLYDGHSYFNPDKKGKKVTALSDHTAVM